MSNLKKLFEQLASRPVVIRGDNPFRLRSTFEEPASLDEVEQSWGKGVPAEVAALWAIARSARLFEDVDYGQWGLVLLDPHSSHLRTLAERKARPHEIRKSDIVLGEFLGDQELLVFCPEEPPARRLLVALPLDPRADWFGAASGMEAFLQEYAQSDGRKYWERQGD